MTQQPPATPNHQVETCPESVIDVLAEAIALALVDRSSVGFYRNCLRQFPLAAIRTAFREATTLPEAQIRKSRGAYFTFLVRRLSAERRPGSESNS